MFSSLLSVFFSRHAALDAVLVFSVMFSLFLSVFFFRRAAFAGDGGDTDVAWQSATPSLTGRWSVFGAVWIKSEVISVYVEDGPCRFGPFWRVFVAFWSVVVGVGRCVVLLVVGLECFGRAPRAGPRRLEERLAG